MKFKPLSVGTLPRVFVNILAFDAADITAFYTAMMECAEMPTWFKTTNFDAHRDDANFASQERTARERLAIFFSSVLNLSKVTRGMFVKDFDRLLDKLYLADFFGTEGQCDPRGDRRD